MTRVAWGKPPIFKWRCCIENCSLVWSEMSEILKFVISRLRDGIAGEHPDADLLTAFAEKSLSDRERANVLMHLSACADCREVVAIAMQATPEPALRAEPQKAPSTWFRWRTLQWGAAAACLVIVGAAVLLKTGAHKKDIMLYSTSDQPAIASQPAAAQTPAEPALRDKLTAKNDRQVYPQVVAGDEARAVDNKRKENAATLLRFANWIAPLQTAATPRTPTSFRVPTRGCAKKWKTRRSRRASRKAGTSWCRTSPRPMRPRHPPEAKTETGCAMRTRPKSRAVWEIRKLPLHQRN